MSSQMEKFLNATAADFNTLAMYGYLRRIELDRDPMSDVFPMRYTAEQMDSFSKVPFEIRIEYVAEYLCWIAVKTLFRAPMINGEAVYNILVATLVIKLEGSITLDDAIDAISDADDIVTDILDVRDQTQKIIDGFNKNTGR